MRRRLAGRRRRGRAPADRDHPGPPGGGHRQDPARRRHRAHPRGRLLPGRLQPGRHPPGRDRLRARPALGRRGPRVRRGAAGGAAGPRGLGRQAGGRLDAVRRERVDPPRRPRRARHQGRAEEPQLAAQPAPGGRLRGRPAAPGPGRRRQARPGDPPLGRGGGADRADAVQGVRHRLPLLPRARPGPHRGHRLLGRRPPGRPARAAGRAPGPAGRGHRPARQGGRLAGPRPRGAGLLRGGGSAPGATPRSWPAG